MQEAIKNSKNIKDELKALKAGQLIIEGIIYQNKKQFKYALDSFEEADLIDSSPYVKFQITSMYIDLYKEFNQQKLYDRALENLEKIIQTTKANNDKKN